MSERTPSPTGRSPALRGHSRWHSLARLRHFIGHSPALRGGGAGELARLRHFIGHSPALRGHSRWHFMARLRHFGRSWRHSFRSMSAGQTLEAGERLGMLMAREFPHGIVVLLVGPLGAGKTVMAKGIARGLGIEDPVISPTYTIISEYRGTAGTLHHIDLYRIEGRDQMENLGLEDIFAGNSFVLVEWGEKLQPTLGIPTPHLRVTISLEQMDAREILIEEVPA